MKKIIGAWVCVLLISACSHIDDYFLGKDNILRPHVLPELTGSATQQVTFKPLWTQALGMRVGNSHLVPVVHDQQIYIASSDGQVQSRDLQTGAVRWQRVALGELTSGPVVAGGRVILGTRMGVLVLSAGSGEVLWQQKLSDQVLAKPLSLSTKIVVKTVDGHVYAFDAKTGKRAWHIQHGAPELILRASSSPVRLSAQQVLVAFADGKLDAIDVATGQIAWDKGLVFANGASDIERLVDIDADPIVQHPLIFIASYQGLIGAFSVETESFMWQHPGSVYQNMSLGGGKLYITDADEVLWALATAHGQVAWKQTHLQARGLTAPVWTSYGILVGDKTGWVHVLSLRDGALIGRLPVSTGVAVEPVVVGNQIIVWTQKGQLSAWRLHKGDRA